MSAIIKGLLPWYDLRHHNSIWLAFHFDQSELSSPGPSLPSLVPNTALVDWSSQCHSLASVSINHKASFLCWSLLSVLIKVTEYFHRHGYCLRLIFICQFFLCNAHHTWRTLLILTFLFHHNDCASWTSEVHSSQLSTPVHTSLASFGGS